jgi:FkbM family methyltransferase
MFRQSLSLTVTGPNPRFKRFIHRSFQSVGFDVVRTESVNGALDSHLANVFRRLEVDCVLDVGANAGQYGAFLRDLGYDGHIISFEPTREAFARLEERARDDGDWSCYNVALGSAATERELNVYGNSMFSSFLSATDDAKSRWGSLSKVERARVRVVRLDDVYDKIIEGRRAHSVFLKMDTQGSDLDVFEGARGCLGDITGLQSEVPFIPLYAGMPRALEFLSAFEREGFQLSGFYPVNRDGTLALIEADCVFVKPSSSRESGR